MRFSTAWAKTAAQNVTLKVATVLLAVIAIIQLIVITGMASRDPLVIERKCFSQMIPAKAEDPSKDEIRSFLREALSIRFDSDGYFKEGFLSIEEVAARDKEQATLKIRQMLQRIVISNITIEGKDIIVTADRLVSVGKIKSTLPLNLKVTLQQTNRTESNPYGLIVGSVSQIEDRHSK